MRRLLLALSLLTFAAACGDDPVSVTSAVGTYNLVSIGGDPLPAPVEGGNATAGSFVLSANQNFTWSETIAVTGAGSTTVTVHGTWSLSGSTITFHPTDAEVNEDETATISGNTMTTTFDATEGARVYTKQ